MNSKQREELQRISAAITMYTLPYGGLQSITCKIPIEEVKHIVDTVLAIPRRNCEVGTPEEQAERFRKFCLDNMKKGGEDFRCHKNCPAKNYINGWGIPYCQLKWAQMPYEK